MKPLLLVYILFFGVFSVSADIFSTNHVIVPLLLSNDGTLLATNAEFRYAEGTNVFFMIGEDAAYKKFDAYVIDSNALNRIGLTLQDFQHDQNAIDEAKQKSQQYQKEMANAQAQAQLAAHLEQLDPLYVMHYQMLKLQLQIESKIIHGTVVKKLDRDRLLIDATNLFNDGDDKIYIGRCILSDYPKAYFDQITNGIDINVDEVWLDGDGVYLDSDYKMQSATNFSCDMNHILKAKWQQKIRHEEQDQAIGGAFGDEMLKLDRQP